MRWLIFFPFPISRVLYFKAQIWIIIILCELNKYWLDLTNLTLENSALQSFDIKTILYSTVALFIHFYHLSFWECLKTAGRNCMLISSFWELKSSFLLCGYNGATKVVETILENDTFRYWSTCSILVTTSVNFLILPPPHVPQFNVV